MIDIFEILNDFILNILYIDFHLLVIWYTGKFEGHVEKSIYFMLKKSSRVEKFIF